MPQKTGFGSCGLGSSTWCNSAPLHVVPLSKEGMSVYGNEWWKLKSHITLTQRMKEPIRWTVREERNKWRHKRVYWDKTPQNTYLISRSSNEIVKIVKIRLMYWTGVNFSNYLFLLVNILDEPHFQQMMSNLMFYCPKLSIYTKCPCKKTRCDKRWAIWNNPRSLSNSSKERRHMCASTDSVGMSHYLCVLRATTPRACVWLTAATPAVNNETVAHNVSVRVCAIATSDHHQSEHCWG